MLKHTVLIVDDDDKIRELLRRFLEPAGYRTTQAASAEEALPLLDALQPTVALCDVHMTGANGLWLAERIRTVSPTTAMILATGDSRVPAAESLRSGVVAYLVKPLRRDQVIAAVADAVRWSTEAIARGVQPRPQRQLKAPLH